MKPPFLGFGRCLCCLFLFRKLRGAVRAARCVDIDLREAVRALLRRRSSRRLFFDAERDELVDALEQAEQDEGHDEEVDQRRDEGRSEAGDILQRIHLTARDHVEDRVDEVIRERGDDAGERTSDNNTDSHVHHVAAKGKGLKFFDKFLHVSSDISFFPIIP